jgi:hypothetical protein
MWNKIKTLILSWFGFKRKPIVAVEKDVKVVTNPQEYVSAKQKTVPMTPAAGSVIKQLKRTHRKNPTYS